MAILNKMNNSMFGNMPQTMNMQTPRAPISTQGGMQNTQAQGLPATNNPPGGLLNRGGGVPTSAPFPVPVGQKIQTQMQSFLNSMPNQNGMSAIPPQLQMLIQRNPQLLQLFQMFKQGGQI